MCSRTLVHMFSSCMYRQAIHSCDRRRFDGPVSHMRWNMKWEVIHNPLVYQHSCPDASIGKVVEATARRQKIKIQKKVGTSKIIIYIFNSMCVLCMNKIQCAFELDFIDPAVWSDHIHDTHTNATENKKYKLKQHEEGEANKKGTVFFLSLRRWLLVVDWTEAMKYCGDAVATADAVVAANIAAGHSLTLMHRSFMNSLDYCIQWIRIRYNSSKKKYIFRFGNLMLVCRRMDGHTPAHDVMQTTLYLWMNLSDQRQIYTLMYCMSRMRCTRRSPLSAKRLSAKSAGFVSFLLFYL